MLPVTVFRFCNRTGDSMVSRLKRILFSCYRPIFITFIMVDTFILGIITVLVSFFDPRGNIVYYIGNFWSKLNLLLGGVRLSVKGRENIVKGQSYIVMSNHQSHYDVWAILGYLPLQIRWVMKMELRKVPIFGYACEKMGQIYIDRGHSEKARKSLEVAGEKIRAGASVVFFPEGTRSPDGNLLPFKKGGFVIALAAGVPILPVTVVGGRDILPKGSLKMIPGKIAMTFHQPIMVDGYRYETKEELIARVRGVIEAGIR